MIEELNKFDRTTVAGIFARAALSLSYLDNPGTSNVVNGEEYIRAKLLAAIRRQLGINEDDNRPEAIERIGEFLDAESEKVIDPPDTKSALLRMAERGDLPSDLYEINIIKNVIDIHGERFPLERDLIETTIRAPTREQHYGPHKNPHEPAMVSLFARSFQTRWPYKDFVMLVAARRDGFGLDVHQAWRLYPSVLDMKGLSNRLVDWLHRFADAYGTEIQVGHERGHFFLFTNSELPRQFTIDLKSHKPSKKPRLIGTLSYFSQQADSVSGTEQSALVVAIDIEKYQALLEKMAVNREDVLDEFVPAPQPTY